MESSPTTRSRRRAWRARAIGLGIALAPRAVLWLAPLSTRELGLLGEELAARALWKTGWRILGRRVATPAGEVDLVARAGDLLAAVEVKAGRVGELEREDSPWRPGGRVGPERVARQRHAARWLAACLGVPRARFDLVEVLVRGRRARLVFHADLEEPLPAPAPTGDRPWLRGTPAGGAAERLV